MELRLAKIKTLEEANEFLKTYLDKHNKQFGVKASNENSMFIPCTDTKGLSVILSVQEERISTGGSEISFEGARYRLTKGKEKILMRKGETVTVLRSMDGVLRGIWHDEIYDLVVSPSAPVITTKTKRERKKNIPSAEHPWRRWDRKTKANRLDSDWQVKTAV